MRHAREALSRERLADLAWGGEFYGDLRLVDTHVSRLRAKLKEAGIDPGLVATVRGVGYAFRPPG